VPYPTRSIRTVQNLFGKEWGAKLKVCMNRREALDEILNYSSEVFIKKAELLQISKERAIQFSEVLIGNISVDHFNKFDIEEFAIKHFHSPEIYHQIRTSEHNQSKCDAYEYDPAKNGQNIIKHGLAFGEVVSYSSRFGSVMIPIPHELDVRRVLIFSDLVLNKEREIELPLSKIRNENFTLSVAVNIDGKFRLISSKLLSSKKRKFVETVKQSIGDINFSSTDSRTEFTQYCIEIFERNFQHTL
jgi:uncharacterized DUF497 family protein